MLLLCANDTYAQKKEIAEAKAALKEGKNLDKAEGAMLKVLQMPDQKNSLDNHLLLTDIVRKQYDQANELLYLNQLKDTTIVFTTLKKMFGYYETLDSVDALPDKKGQSRPRHRQKNADFLDKFRPNLFKGGIYYIRSNKYKEAYECMDCYLNCHTMPLFASKKYPEKDKDASEAAFWATMSAIKQKDMDGVRKYGEWALKYESKQAQVMAMLYDAYAESGDTVKAVEYLRRGFNEHPEHRFFFPRIVDYYAAQNHLDSVVVIVDRANELEPGNLFYRLARNTIQLNMGEYNACIALGDSIIHTNDNMAEAYMNVGSAYFNKALNLNKREPASRKKTQEVNELYRKAMPYVEKYRILRPRRKDHWAPMLYTIYLNLNIGDKFDEIDNILKSNKQNQVITKK